MNWIVLPRFLTVSLAMAILSSLLSSSLSTEFFLFIHSFCHYKDIVYCVCRWSVCCCRCHRLLHVIWKIRTRHFSNYWKTKAIADPSNIVKLLSNCFLFYISYVYLHLLNWIRNEWQATRLVLLTAIRLAVPIVCSGIFVPLRLPLLLLHFRLIFFTHFDHSLFLILEMCEFHLLSSIVFILLINSLDTHTHAVVGASLQEHMKNIFHFDANVESFQLRVFVT